jgi:drug/metabolite transporter (DMT)-like permease
MLTQGAGFRASPQGLFWILVACTSWSAGSVMSQRRWTLAPGATGFASEMLCGGCALMLMSVLAGEPASAASNWPFQAKAVLAWVYLVVFGSLLAFNAYMVLLARTSGALASSYTFVNPVIAMLLGVLLAGESVTGFEWLSTAVIVLGVILLIVRRSR